MPRYQVDPAVAHVFDKMNRTAVHRDIDDGIDPYRAQRERDRRFLETHVPAPSYFRDLLAMSDAEARARKTLDRAIAGGPPVVSERETEQPTPGYRNDSVAAARSRVARVLKKEHEQRDLSSSTVGNVLHPSAPGWLGDIWGKANRQSGTLAAVLERQPLEDGMVDTSGGALVLKSVPRLSSGAAVAVQGSQNSAVQETDPTDAAITTPIGWLAGQVDMSRQVFDRSRPGLDEAIASDLGSDFGTKLDVQIVNGSGSTGQLRGLLNVSGVLTVTGDVTSSATFQASIWKAYSALAGTSGVGASNPEDFITILHPRRYAWARGSTTGIAAQELFPGTVAVSAGVPTNLGAGTNEDRAIVLERSNVILVGGDVRFRVFQEVASSTLTVRSQCFGDAALLVLNPAAVAVVTGLTAPTGF